MGGAVIGREQVIHPRLSGRRVPAQGGHLVHAELARAHHELPRVDVGLQHRQGAVVEKVCVIVVGRAAEQLDVEGALPVLQAEGVDDGCRLLNADLVVVEGGVVIDVRRPFDEPVVGDHPDAALARLRQHIAEGRTVDGSDHQDLRARGEHVLDLGELRRDVVVRVLQVRLVAPGLQKPDDVVAVVDPALRRLGRHGDPDRIPAGRLHRCHGRRSQERQAQEVCENGLPGVHKPPHVHSWTSF